ncbi:hypothetical protein ATER59S_02231 [Aquamicrobium terrae]|uniref:ion channel n=1 Tax=Mesorhizobium sp. PUT5 TaxID=3454629 RepID=UPI003FA4AD78
MAANLFLATALNVATFLVHAAGLMVLSFVIAYLLDHPLIDGRQGEKVLAMVALALGLFALVCSETAMWAIGMVAVGAFHDFATAFYFSTSAFATIGFTDAEPEKTWRLLGSMEGITGLLIMGWTAAYLVTSSIRFGPFERDKHF